MRSAYPELGAFVTKPSIPQCSILDGHSRVIFRSAFRPLPLAPKTDLFKKLYIETIIRNPKKVGFSGHR